METPPRSYFYMYRFSPSSRVYMYIYLYASASCVWPAAGQDVAPAPKPEGFVVSKTQGGRCRRLHFVGGCWRIPGEHYRNFVDFGQEVPADHLFNARCKDCFPAALTAERAAEEEVEGSASDGSASSSSSGSGAGDFADIEPGPSAMP